MRLIVFSNIFILKQIPNNYGMQSLTVRTFFLIKKNQNHEKNPRIDKSPQDTYFPSLPYFFLPLLYYLREHTSCPSPAVSYTLFLLVGGAINTHEQLLLVPSAVGAAQLLARNFYLRIRHARPSIEFLNTVFLSQNSISTFRSSSVSRLHTHK